MKRLVILGAGGYGSVVADVARQLDYEIIQSDDADVKHPLDSYTDYIGEGMGNSYLRLGTMHSEWNGFVSLKTRVLKLQHLFILLHT